MIKVFGNLFSNSLSLGIPLLFSSLSEFIKGFLGSEYHDERGFLVVSILLLANLFLGIYYNLSIWYKLTDKTKYGAYLAIFGALITITLNIILIPSYGINGAAIATAISLCIWNIVSVYIIKRNFGNI